MSFAEVAKARLGFAIHQQQVAKLSEPGRACSYWLSTCLPTNTSKRSIPGKEARKGSWSTLHLYLVLLVSTLLSAQSSSSKGHTGAYGVRHRVWANWLSTSYKRAPRAWPSSEQSPAVYYIQVQPCLHLFPSGESRGSSRFQEHLLDIYFTSYT